MTLLVEIIITGVLLFVAMERLTPERRVVRVPSDRRSDS